MALHGFATVTHALEWLKQNSAAVVLTELDFPQGASGLELIQYLRRPGYEAVPIIATSAHDRRAVGAERLARLDVLFIPKPLNLPFVVGMIAGSLRHGARRSTALATRALAPGEVLFREGDLGTEVFIVRRGLLRITRRAGNAEVELGVAEPGEMVGEMGFVEQTARAATLTALEPTELAVLDLESVREFLERQPAWLRLMLQSLIGHLRETREKVNVGRGEATDRGVAEAVVPPVDRNLTGVQVGRCAIPILDDLQSIGTILAV
jgi:CheY-like chemotaxis protein